MDKAQPVNLTRLRFIVTIIISILIIGLLVWTHFHGGVPSHHILHRSDLPAISNWWGGIVLPVLTWILSGKIKNRIEKQTETGSDNKSKMTGVSLRFVIGLVFGIILSVSFVYNYKPFLDNVLYLIPILSLLIPIFYSEFILGFVLGMTYTFGAVLPTVFALVMAAIGYPIYRIAHKKKR